MPILGKSESLEARAAFETWYAQPLNAREDFAAVARSANVPVEKVQKWVSKFHWRAMARRRDEEVAVRVEEHQIELAVNVVRRYAGVLRNIIDRWVQLRLDDADVDIATLAGTKVTEIGALMKLHLDLISRKDVQDAASANDKPAATDEYIELTPAEIKASLADIAQARSGDATVVGSA